MSTYKGSLNNCNRMQRKRAAEAVEAAEDERYEEVDSKLPAPPQESIIKSWTPEANNLKEMKILLFAGISVAPGVCLYTFRSLLTYASNCNWYQLPGQSKQASSSAGCRRLGSNFHTINGLLVRRDIKPSNPRVLPLVPNSEANKKMCDDFYDDIICMLVRDLGMCPQDEALVVVRLQRYLEETWIGKHADGDRVIGDLIHRMRLVIGIGPSRMIKFTANMFDLDNPTSNGTVVKGLSHIITTDDCASAYLMTENTSGMKDLCYMDNKRRKAVTVHHEVPKNESNLHTIIGVIDFPLRSMEAKEQAKKFVRNNVVSLRRSSSK